MTNTTYKTNIKILSIDTSCDETSAAITKGLTILSNVVWSQSKVHSKYGGVVPSKARREHERKIFWVVKRAVNTAKIAYQNLDAISVTVGPGLAIALEVGINFAKSLAEKYKKPLIAINHLEGHLLSALAEIKNQKSKIPPGQRPSWVGDKNQNYNSKSKNILNTKIAFQSHASYNSQPPATNYQLPTFPAFGVVVSGGNTLLVLIEKIGKYEVLAQTIDDALGESLDKSARLLGLGYPGGAVLEKFAKLGNPKTYPLPTPMLGRESEGRYSYSGLKTAFYRIVENLRGQNVLSKTQICNLAASYQHMAFEHFIRVTRKVLANNLQPTLRTRGSSEPVATYNLLVGGGVAANVELRKRIRKMCKELSIIPLFPYTKKLYGDNAAIIGVAAHFKYLKKDFIDPEKIDRLPNLKIDE